MKKNWRLLTCLLALPALPLLAQFEDQEIAFEEQETVLEAQETVSFSNPGSSKKTQPKNMPQPEEEKIHSQAMITPSAAPYISEGSDVFASVEFIWWKTAISGTEYAFTGTADNGHFVPFGASPGSGRVKTPELEFQPGFKLGLGVNFAHDGWDLYANYTYLSGPEEKNSVAAVSGTGAGTLIPTQLNIGSGTTVNFTTDSCTWSQDFNVVDLELGRNFFISRHLTMRPHAGFKTGWILDKGVFKVIPVSGTADGTDNSVLAISSLRSQHLWGLGIRTGMDTGWHVTKNWSFYADFALTTLWADFHIKNSDSLTESISANKPLDTKETFQTVIPVIETGIGLAYITWWDQNRYRFQVQGGWEEQVWLDYNHFMYLGQAGGSLAVHGLTLKAMLTF